MHKANADLTDIERENSLAVIAEGDVDGWKTYKDFEINLLDDGIYAYFNGYSMGPSDFDFKLFSFFKTNEELLKYLANLPMRY